MYVNKEALKIRTYGVKPQNKNIKKQINYKKTYFEIDFNVHLMDMTCGQMHSTQKTHMSVAVQDAILHPVDKSSTSFITAARACNTTLYWLAQSCFASKRRDSE
jgi:hypothetical protein